MTDYSPDPPYKKSRFKDGTITLQEEAEKAGNDTGVRSETQ